MDFFKCGATGLILEIFWTGAGNYIAHDKKMTGSTSLLMFPIYGMASFLKPLYRIMRKFNLFIRGIFYTVLIYVTEFFSGMYLKKHGCCPWDYSKSKYNIKGVIRLDYAPVWFVVGLLYEKILIRKK